MRVAIILGKLGAAVHGKLDAARAFDDENSFVTGTVGGFLTIAWGLAERGHTVDAFCDAKETVTNCAALGGANVYPFDLHRPDGSYDVYMSVLEPDVLRHVPVSKPKILVQWLNDFTYCRPGHEAFIDLYACPSETHRTYLVGKSPVVKPERTTVVPLACNPELYEEAERRPFSVAYASSPDRGLHNLLSWWPDIRERVPGAELRVYYRVLPWCDEILREPGQRGSMVWHRAKIVRKAFDELGTKNENGLTLVGPLPPRKMLRELGQTEVLAYPLDPVRFTEGFSMTVLDACASGCVPVLSGKDAFPELWWGCSRMIFGDPSLQRAAWVNEICKLLTDKNHLGETRTLAKLRARDLTRPKVAAMWEREISKLLEHRPKRSFTDEEIAKMVSV